MSTPGARTFVRYLKKSSKANSQFLITLFVRPGVERSREGIFAISDSHVTMNLVNRNEDGAANRSVEIILARKLSLPTSHVQIINGLSSREKVAEVKIISRATPESKVAWLMSMLHKDLKRSKNIDNEGNES